MPAENRLEYAIQATASVWEPLEQVHYVVSGDVDFDSFGMTPWDAGGMHGDSCQLRETLRTMMLQWLMRLLCRPVIMNGLDRTMRMNTENGLDGSMITNTESPRLAVTPGEWYASETIRVIRTDLRQMNGFTEMMGAMCDYTTAEVYTQIDSAAADCGAGDFIFRRTSFPQDELSVGRDGNYTEDYSTVWGFPHIDSAVVAYGAGAVELDDWVTRFRIGSVPVVQWIDDWVTRYRIFPETWTMLSMAGSPEVPLCHHLLPAVSRSASHEVEAPFLSPLFRHPVWPDGGSVFADELSMYELAMSLYAPLCRQLLFFDPAVHRTTSGEGEMFSLPPCFILILTFCYCFYDFLRELQIA